MVLARIRFCAVIPITQRIKLERARVDMSDFTTIYTWEHITMIDCLADVSHIRPLFNSVA
jgi:hypothetical protein